MIKIRVIHVFSFLIAALLFPALFINLGLMPIMEDEAIRALVALEMFLNNDYFSPTIAGEPYLKKPPLYNWVLCGFYFLFGNHNEFIVRLPMIISLLLFFIVIFLTLRSKTGSLNALFIAFAFVTSGRVLTYESQKGLIDILFSMIIFLNIHFLFQLIVGKGEGWYYVLSYLVCSLAFLLKGLPAVAFQVITLVVLVFFSRKIGILFSKWHLAGIILFFFIVGGYYFLHITKSQSSFGNILSWLVSETTRRTALRFGVVKTLKHLFTFPFEFLYWFIPWTVFALSFFQKGIWLNLNRKPYFRFLFLALIANIILYWTSPEVFARYVLMFVPMFYTLAFAGYQMLSENSNTRNAIHYILIGFAIIIFIAFNGLYFHPVVKVVDYFYLKAIPLSVSSLVLLVFSLRKMSRIPYTLLGILLIIRIGFNWFVLPYRYSETHNQFDKAMAQEIVNHTKGYPFYCYWPENIKPDEYYGKRIINYATMFYIASGKKETIRTQLVLIPEAYYLIREKDISNIKAHYLKVRDFSEFNNDCVLVFLSGDLKQ